ncbi:MAG: 4Fe-4S dicluster domain-containing protein [Planctomycetaceae bacterium]|nr:4Fe-4S dicluster domain-containing protein [Planctomycetaceae bacterium]
MTLDKLKEIISTLISNGKRVIAPVEAAGKYFYREISEADKVGFDSEIKPTNSIKEFFFPQHEKICGYCYKGKELEVSDADSFIGEQVIFGSRPCEAAALPILDKVFGWDFQDNFFQQRRKQTTVITLTCVPDEFCFCSSVGLSPAVDFGADAMLVLSGGEFGVRIFTDKGKAIFGNENLPEQDNNDKTTESPKIKFDAGNVQNYLSEHFVDDVFDRLTVRCLGCGACTYVCPTCHCFDIVDEGGAFRGERVKNWDSCQFPFFTLHASGHNPRPNQSARQRNRIQHKFRIYPDKFGSILCTGCGNCARECSVNLGVLPYIELLDKKSKTNDK